MKKAVSFVITLLLLLCGAGFFAYGQFAGTESSGGSPVEEIEEYEKNPAIQNMINSYIYDQDQWWSWYESLPEDDDNIISRLHVLTWIELASNLPEEERPVMNSDLLYLPQRMGFGEKKPEPPEDVRALIEEYEKDPDIREMVERYAPDARQWWDWYETLPDEHESDVSKLYALKWVKSLSGATEEQIGSLSYNMFGFAYGLAREGVEFKPYNEEEHTDPDIERIEELRQDAAVIETVERYAPDPERWWDWYETLPEKDDVNISRLYALEWVKLFSMQAEEDREGLRYNLLQEFGSK